MSRSTREITRTVVEAVDAYRCDRCGTDCAAPYIDQRPDGWVIMKGAAPSAAVEDYCSEECAAQTLAARVGKVLA